MPHLSERGKCKEMYWGKPWIKCLRKSRWHSARFIFFGSDVTSLVQPPRTLPCTFAHVKIIAKRRTIRSALL